MDITYLIEFYNSPLGKKVIEEIAPLINPTNRSANQLYIGFPLPYLNLVAPPTLFAMDRRVGATAFPEKSKNKVTLVDLNSLPFPDECFDQITVIHALEFAESPTKFMRELWRIVSPEGHLSVIVPNRRSIWCHLESTPLGHGKPYSMSELSELAKDTQFEVIGKKRGLYSLPFTPWQPQFLSKAQKYFMEQLTPKLSGVIGITAKKRVYCKTLPKERKRLVTPESAIRAKVSSFEDRG